MRKIAFYFFIITLCFGISVAANDEKYQDKIYPHVFVNDVDFSGKNRADVISYFENKNKNLTKNVFIFQYKDNDIATYSAQSIRLAYDSQMLANHAYSIGRSTNYPTRILQKVMSLLYLKTYEFEGRINFDERTIKDYLFYLDDKYSYPAENALFKFENGKVTTFKFEKYGLQILPQGTLNNFIKTVAALDDTTSKKIRINILEEVVKPAVTMASSNEFGIAEKVSVGKSDYTGSIPGRVHNVLLATNKFNGVLIKKGETFSFNKVIGNISAATGYEQAYIIKEGRTVLGDGGGVCQVSTTIFRAALNAGLPITERWAHAYRVHYYENDMKPGFDSTVFSPSNDLKFINDLPSAILIQTEVNEKTNELTYTFYGKRDGRKVEVSDAIIWDVFPAPDPKYEDDPTLRRGLVKQVDWAAVGTKSRFTYKVTKNNKLTIDTTFYSYYKPWAAIYMVGTAN